MDANNHWINYFVITDTQNMQLTYLGTQRGSTILETHVYKVEGMSTLLSEKELLAQMRYTLESMVG